MSSMYLSIVAKLSLKRLKIYRWAKDIDAHIIFLQETHFTDDIVKKHAKYDWSGRAFHSVGTS